MNAAGNQTCGSRSVAPEPAFRDVNTALNAAMTKVQTADRLRTEAGDTVTTGFLAARDAVDPDAATELAAVIVHELSSSRALLNEASELASQYSPVAAVSSHPRTPTPAVSEPTALDFGLHHDLVAELDAAIVSQRELEVRLMGELSPQEFRGALAAGKRVAPEFTDPLDGVMREASFTIDLLITAVAIEERVAGGGRADTISEAVGLANAWQTRAMNLMFLEQVTRAILGPRWLIFSIIPGPDGQTFANARHGAQQRAEIFGLVADIGSYDPDRMTDLLTYGVLDWAVTDENALDAFSMIASASPAARLVILQQLEDRGLLARLCSNLPTGHVQALLEAIGGNQGREAPPIASTLRRYLNDNQVSGTTVTELYEEEIMENLAKGNNVRAYLWTLLNTAHSALTLGAKDIHDQAYIARRKGLISADAYWSTTALAAGRTAALLALTAGVGTAAGGFSEGIALARGAGATTSSLLGAAAGGGAAGLAGQFGADVFDQAFLGKEGFSSLGDYGTAAAIGVGSGLLVAGVGAASARYLPGGRASAQRMGEYHTGSPAGEYRFAQSARQALHRGLYQAYRQSSFAGRALGRMTGLPPGQFEANFEWVGAQGRRHIFYGEDAARGGHLWPPNPEGGPTLADPASRAGPKSSYPRTWNQEHIMEAVAEAVSSPTQPWYRSGQVGVGAAENGLPFAWHNANTRFATRIVVDGVDILIISRPTSGGVITAYPVGAGDPANLLMAVQPQPTSASPDEK